mgnify:CR=1 FL=1
MDFSRLRINGQGCKTPFLDGPKLGTKWGYSILKTWQLKISAQKQRILAFDILGFTFFGNEIFYRRIGHTFPRSITVTIPELLQKMKIS